ncbi:MAG: hypothetical protein ABI625_03225 [bacterium]
MKIPSLPAVALMLSCASLTLGAQQATATSQGTVLFVCEHGTVRSLLAKVLFEQYAKEVGLNMLAVSRGTSVDSAVPAFMLQGLKADHVTLGSWRPQTLGPSDLADASYVVSFDVPLAATATANVPRAQWDALPPVSQNYAVGRDAIKMRVHELVDSLKRAKSAARP